MDFIKAKKSDLNLILDIIKNAILKYEKENIFQWNSSYPSEQMILGDIINEFTYLIVEGNNIIGFFVINNICEDNVHNNVQWLNQNSTFLIIHRLCIDVKSQNKGKGTEALKNIISSFAFGKVRSVRVDVFSANFYAIHIYEKLGFTRLDEAICDRGKFYIYENIL
ncbi:MAG: GNAT family N-acetyltransferase [Bacilli bacterium]|jgi:ribosomal protein S18 acetylase RimI-like enzyme